MKKPHIGHKLPLYVFAFCATVLITFQITYLYVNNQWKSRVSDMIRTDKTTLSEGLSSLDSVVKSKSVYKPDTASLVDGTMAGYLSGTQDRFSMYLTPVQYNDYISGTAQSSNVGIGISALYDMRVGGIYIVNVYPSSPASKAGLEGGDVITSVNGTPVSKMGFYSAMLAIGNGELYSGVVLKVTKSDGTSTDLTLTRQIVETVGITSDITENVGIVKIYQFTQNSSEDFKNEVQKLISKGADRFVIDVRNNAGGSPDHVAELLDFLLPDSVTITGSDRDGAVKQYKSDPAEFTYPVILAVNKNTVFGAELFAAAMKDIGGALLVGETTYGKATSQQIYPLPDGSAVSLSTMIYTTPKGASFDGVGLAPDFSVILTSDILDDQLLKAVELVKEMEYLGPNNS